MIYSLDDLKDLQKDNPLLMAVEEEEDDVEEESVFFMTLDGECGDPVYGGELEEMVDLYNKAGQPYKAIFTSPRSDY